MTSYAVGFRDSERKSMSTERTFGELSVPSDLYDMCSKLTESLVEDLKQEKIVVSSCYSFMPTAVFVCTFV